MYPLNIPAQFEIRSFTRAWYNRGYPKKLGSHWIRPRFLFSKIFHGLLFEWTLGIYWLNLNSVAFPVPEIIGGNQKIWAVPGYAHASFSATFFMRYYSDGHCYCSGRIWSSYSVTRSRDNSDWNFGWGANPQSWGRGSRRVSKERR